MSAQPRYADGRFGEVFRDTVDLDLPFDPADIPAPTGFKDLKPGRQVVIDGRLGTVIDAAATPRGGPGRFVQFDDGSVVRVEKTPSRVFGLQVTADADALRRQTRILNVFASRRAYERRVESMWWGSGGSRLLRHIVYAEVHVGECACPGPETARALPPSAPPDMMLTGVGRTSGNPVRWADCVTSAAGVTPDRPLVQGGIVGTAVRAGKHTGTIVEAGEGSITIKVDSRYRDRYVTVRASAVTRLEDAS